MPVAASPREAIVVLDYGSQYSQLIVRRVRESRVYAEILPWDASKADLDRIMPRGIILSGGPSSVYDPGAPYLAQHVLERGVPVLGICYGMHLLARQLGGHVVSADRREYGLAEIELEGDGGPLLAGTPARQQVWMSHGDRVEALPEGFRPVARSENTPFGAVEHRTHPWYALQFHPEVAHSEYGATILANFVHGICACGSDWTPSSIIEDSIASVQQTVGGGRVICGLSGGVDSTVVATLVHRAVGERLTAIFVNTGLLRKNEAVETVTRFRQEMGDRLHYVDASETFLSALDGVTDPERKRVIIGNTFIDVFDREAELLGQVGFLAQGTLYPDVIESAQGVGRAAARIKTHHNVGGLPDGMRMKLIEPLRYLFKDEVRAVGLALGLPADLVHRPPFPGPGLAVRCIGEVTPERLAVLRRVDDIFVSALHEFGLYQETWQALAVLTPLRSVGVKGDGRTYAYTVALRAVTSVDGMTADWVHLPHEFLATVSTRITNAVPEVNRVVYDITSKPPATIEWE